MALCPSSLLEHKGVGARRGPRGSIVHPSFEEDNAETAYGEDGLAWQDLELPLGHMQDAVTRDRVRRMHYAAYRQRQAHDPAEAEHWRDRYVALRNQVVVGNHKLVFAAVRRYAPQVRHCDDLFGECSLVLIRAVESYNPWRGVRFSTYACICLMRAVARLRRRFADDAFAKVLALGRLASAAPDVVPDEDEPLPARLRAVLACLQKGHPLLSDREKLILRHRYGVSGAAGVHTLERISRRLGLSKERVRQLQARAVSKLQRALLDCPTLL
jgi:RNA polymerase primary sigma factor/RNA polymerase sigma factor